MRRLAAVLLVATVTTGLGACAAEPAPAASGSWTVLTYEIADTDLEPYMMVDVAEMAEVTTDESISILSFVDRASDYTDEDVLGLGDWEGAKLLEISGGGATELDDLGDVNTGDPAVLTDFIARGIAEYPADNYALIISDHGASWPGVGGDESSESDSLTLDELQSGLADGIAAAGIDKLDLLGFDACLMATFEVASAMAPLADRMLASQELEPGHGWDYTALQLVSDQGGATVDELGSALIDGFEAQAKSEETSAEITLSLIDLTAMPAVDAALASFSTALTERAAGVAPTVGRTLAQTLGFGRSPDPEQDLYLTDLAILAGEIGVDALDVSDEADDVVRAVNDAVVDKVDGQATTGATGLSIYFPPTQEFYNADYDALGVDGGWVDFLAAYYAAGTGIPAAESASLDADSAEYSVDGDGLTLSATIGDTSSVAEAYIRYGTLDDNGDTVFLGKEPADIDGDTASGSWDLTTLEISDGEDATAAFVDLAIDDDKNIVTIDVPMGYYSAADVEGETYQNALLSLVVDQESWELVTETYYAYQESTGGYGELSADAEGIISPELLTVHDDGSEEWLATSDYGLYADLPNLSYDFPTVASGTELYIELTIVDFGGNEDTVYATATAP